MLAAYQNEGWLNQKLSNDSCIHKIIELLLNEYDYDGLRPEVNTEFHQQKMIDLQNIINEWKVQEEICRDLSEIISLLLGSNKIGVSSTIYLRGVRPNGKTDILVEALPWHREIFYSDYDYANHQINLHIPLINYNSQTCMKYIDKSHIIPDSKIHLKKVNSEVSGVSKFSTGHKMGLPYNPKLISNIHSLGEIFDCPAEVSNAFIFNSRLVHGAGGNKTNSMRFSMDFAVLPFDKLEEQKKFHFASYKQGSHFYELSL